MVSSDGAGGAWWIFDSHVKRFRCSTKRGANGGSKEEIHDLDATRVCGLVVWGLRLRESGFGLTSGRHSGV